MNDFDTITEDNHAQIITKGIVLRIFESGESNIVARILTASHGKLAAVARHIKKSQKRFSANLDIFDCGVFTLRSTRSGDLWGVEAFRSETSLYELRKDLDKLSAASLLAECFDLLLKDGHNDLPAEALYEVLELSLRAINEASSIKESLRAVFTGLSYISQALGVSALAGTAPSTKSLTKLLDDIEDFLERQLATRAMINEVLCRIQATSTHK